MLKLIAALLTALISVTGWADSAPYRGPDGQVEAYGMVAGTYFSALAVLDICGENPAYKREAEEATRNYLNANHQLYLNVGRRLAELAQKNGGEKERLRLKAELHETHKWGEKQARVEMQKQIKNANSCTSILANIRKGVMDLKTQRKGEIALIFE